MALRSNSTGFDNTAIGFYALRDNTTGSGNTATGVSALQDNTMASNNTANGFRRCLATPAKIILPPVRLRF
jgi:hypothetical protein